MKKYSAEDEPYLDCVFRNTHLSEEQIDENVSNAESIFKNMPSPDNGLEKNVGLVVGKVQSGKTANIIALTAYAFNHGYRVAIMLLADTNTLLNQNAERIKNAFRDIEDIEIVVEAANGDFRSIDNKTLEYLYRNNKRIIICSLKHFGRIAKVCNTIKESSYANDYSLIVDDEADDVSQNTSRNKVLPGHGSELDRSSTNKSIHDLMNIFNKLAYVSVTASPEANILLQTYQSLAPDYCVTIEPGRDYYDIVNFHDPNNNKIEVINDYDPEKFKQEPYVPNSLYDALCYFITGILVRKNRGEIGFKASFLVHTSQLIYNHKLLFARLRITIDAYDKALHAENIRGAEFLEDIRAKYRQFREEDEITMSDVAKVFDDLKIHCFNNQSDEKDINSSTKWLPYHIVVGGNMLDRGITLPDLTVTYMTRESKVGQADTLLQRARWLGYKKGFFDLCKIYLTPTLKFQFEELIDHYDSVWNYLTICANLGINLKDQQPQLVIDSNVLRAASPAKVYVKYTNLTSNYAQRIIVKNSAYNLDNINLLSEYENRTGSFITYNSTQTHKIIKITLSDLINIIENFHVSDSEGINGLKSLLLPLKKVENPGNVCVDLYRMRVNDNEERTPASKNDSEIICLLQGRSPGKVPGDPDFYPGDRYLTSENIILQVHHVILTENISDIYSKGEEVVMLALIFPPTFGSIGVVERTNIV